MREPLEIQFPAMLAYVSFPDTWFTGADFYYEDVRQLDSIVLAVDEQAFAVKKAGAIAAKRMIIATNKTQNNNFEASPEEVRKHPDLAKAAILLSSCAGPPKIRHYADNRAGKQPTFSRRAMYLHGSATTMAAGISNAA